MSYKHVPQKEEIKIADEEGDVLDITDTGRARTNDYVGNILMSKIVKELKEITRQLKKINSKG